MGEGFPNPRKEIKIQTEGKPKQVEGKSNQAEGNQNQR
jgi:hypothetical protein